MAAAFCLQLGPGWVGKLWERQFGEPSEVMLFNSEDHENGKLCQKNLSKVQAAAPCKASR